MATPETMRVEVVYALPDRQAAVSLTLPHGMRVKDAIAQSGLLQRFPDIDLAQNRVGIFSRIVTLEADLNDGDRVEIYRPLTRDPKQARRELAKAGKTMGREPKD